MRLGVSEAEYVQNYRRGNVAQRFRRFGILVQQLRGFAVLSLEGGKVVVTQLRGFVTMEFLVLEIGSLREIGRSRYPPSMPT